MRIKAASNGKRRGSKRRPHRLVYICDWLPPDFGAVGQYSLQAATERASRGQHVLLAGLSSTASSIEHVTCGSGRLTIRRFKCPQYNRADFVRRVLWTLRTNSRMVARLLPELAAADEILFTGSPPLLIHLLAPLNILLRKKLTYRITDFHPECAMAGRETVPLALRLLYRLTLAWRRRVSRFEVLGEDQRRRLLEIGIPRERISLKRDTSPMAIAADTLPLPRPADLGRRLVLLYSGNFGYAHDHETFLQGYRLHHRRGSGRFGLWLNAVGAKADLVEQALRADGLPVYRSHPAPLDLLPRLLVAADAHLITLRSGFAGFVLPSKVYGCIQSGRPVLFIGSTESDIDLLCREQIPQRYFHVANGRPEDVAAALEDMAHRTWHTGDEVQPGTEQKEEQHSKMLNADQAVSEAVAREPTVLP